MHTQGGRGPGMRPGRGMGPGAGMGPGRGMGPGQGMGPGAAVGPAPERILARFDVDHDGKLDETELRAFLSERRNRQGPPAHAQGPAPRAVPQQ
jgi:hypothetical protein